MFLLLLLLYDELDQILWTIFKLEAYSVQLVKVIHFQIPRRIKRGVLQTEYVNKQKPRHFIGQPASCGRSEN
jgi:hypothetical protein